MSTRSPALRALHVHAVTCLLALGTLPLTACKARSDAGAVTDSAAMATVAPLGDTAMTAAAPATAAPAAATPAVAKPAAAKAPATAPATAPAPPAPPPPKVYPPFDSKASAASIGVVVYPKQGQTIEQQHFDENECYAWAMKSTGIDPTAPAAQAAAPTAQQGGAVKGAAKGAAAGVAIGAVAGDAGKGAAIGATAGAIGGRSAQKRGNQAAASSAQQEAASAESQRQKTFASGFTTCMDGRNYSAK